ncbi:uncharacterized protein BKCO1_1600050 [Diplodia corticola]|uniref:Uncharacterized protein n=1 Tax=Diplodia corticola TaxID=236234 RepID=A0A1J9R2C9_9PEZI|nr:uncharacterized protein BKCO1_1600050 [Diplodia corticola]OJD35550.1 hypothetical protein BKCO1_1600050 [Diplodia corticola]
MSSSHHPHQPYTPLQQDRQARNRPAHIHSAAAPHRGRASGGASNMRQQHQQRAALARDETFEERERRYNAARILESNEMLIWHSVARNESLPQTRLHFEKIVAGFDSDDSDPEWDDATPPPPPRQQQPSASRSTSGSNKRDRESNSPASRKSRSGTPA